MVFNNHFIIYKVMYTTALHITVSLLELGIFDCKFALDSSHNGRYFSHGSQSCVTRVSPRNQYLSSRSYLCRHTSASSQSCRSHQCSIRSSTHRGVWPWICVGTSACSSLGLRASDCSSPTHARHMSAVWILNRSLSKLFVLFSYQQIVTQAVSNLGQCICRERCNH